ncbi:hypothetical protein [Asticcacaulis solisilvae]|uniref:hypothetical protein n=1 Tax=Asticcacaulis solisilvae TaxID=1217274 RepID=UPI003FD81DA3
MFHEIYIFLLQPFWPTVNQAATLIVCSYAILVGSWRERFVAFAYLVAYLAVIGFELVMRGYATPLSFLADVLCLPAFLWANHKSLYIWTRWALAFQGLSLVADIIPLLGGPGYFAACVIALGVLSYGVLAALLTGTISAQVRKHRERTEDQASARN